MKSNFIPDCFSISIDGGRSFLHRRFAQTGTTSLRGSILDKSGAAVVGATIKLSNADLGSQRVIVSSATGSYEFVALKPGNYDLNVEASGFRKYEQRKFELLVNNPTTLNVTLQVGSTKKRSKCRHKSETLNTTDASLGVAFGENQVKQLPLESRNVGDLLSLQAGVVYTGNNPSITQNEQDTDTRSGAVNGARSDQSNVTLDGIPVNPKGRIRVSVGPSRHARFGRRIPRNHQQRRCR